MVALALVLVTVVGTRGFGNESLGVVLIPAAGIIGVVGFGRRCLRVHPDEPWLPRLLLLGTVAKLVGSYIRYITLTESYDGVGDATRYDIDGRKFVAAWIGERASAPDVGALRGTSFMKWLTGVVYYLFGQNLLAGFLLFGLLALLGSYFWYRALNGGVLSETADSVRYVDKRLFLIFMMFAPSIVFWPSSLGKDALMQLGVGAMAWAIALVFRGRIVRSMPLLLGGGWLIWVVRPHLLALIAVAAAVPYLIGRVSRSGQGSFLARPAGLVVMGVFVVIAVTAGARFVGIENLSVSEVQAQLEEETAQTAKGGSSFSPPSSSLNPVYLPLNLVTVLFRPLPWEARSAFQLLAALESAVLIGLIIRRRDSVRLAFGRCRTDPFLLYCIVLLMLYATAFASFANFGLLTRQRSLVLPALYVLISLKRPLADEDDWLDRPPELTRPAR